MKRSRVNVLTVINSASNITTETIDEKPHIVVRGVVPSLPNRGGFAWDQNRVEHNG